VATYRKRNGKWQAIVRHKDIGTITRSFKAKSLAVKWVAEQENKLEAKSYGLLRPDSLTLGELLSRYCKEITPSKRGATTEERRLNRLINDPVSTLPSISCHHPLSQPFATEGSLMGPERHIMT
jgi:hypothetical protein